MLLDLVVEINHEVGIEFEFINMGGGIGTPYKPADVPVSYALIADGVDQAYEETVYKHKLNPPRVFMECGRIITGPYGWLVSTVLHKKSTYKEFVGLDANMANLMRPAMYGAYHHLTVLGKENAPYDPIEILDADRRRIAHIEGFHDREFEFRFRHLEGNPGGEVAEVSEQTPVGASRQGSPAAGKGGSATHRRH